MFHIYILIPFKLRLTIPQIEISYDHSWFEDQNTKRFKSCMLSLMKLMKDHQDF